MFSMTFPIPSNHLTFNQGSETRMSGGHIHSAEPLAKGLLQSLLKLMERFSLFSVGFVSGFLLRAGDCENWVYNRKAASTYYRWMSLRMEKTVNGCAHKVKQCNKFKWRLRAFLEDKFQPNTSC